MKCTLFAVTLLAAAAVCHAQTSAYTSKYDFVPGDKVIVFEDFAAAEIGDFPLKWNTNASAEVVSLSSKPGKWLKINKEGVLYPEFIKNLPENFTLEFDLAVNEGFISSPFVLNITSISAPEGYKDYYHYVNWNGTHALHMTMLPGADGNPGVSKLVAGKDGNHMVDNESVIHNWNTASDNFAHVSIWRQKQRLRVYVNGEKIWDIPRAFDATQKYNTVTFAIQEPDPKDYFLVNNIRLAVGSPDTRSKLVTEGKFVTTGIRFNTNSADLLPESYGVLKDIGTVLKENPTLKVKIIGHTDADGDDKSNLDLSKRRAAAVKNFLVKEYGIAAANLETDGKGEAEPVDKNTTVEGKANNRRVEFVKM